MSTGTGESRSSGLGLGTRVPSLFLDTLHQQGMARALQLERAVLRDDRFDPADHDRKSSACLDHVEFRRDVDGLLQVVRPGAEAIRQFEQDAPHFLEFLFFERDDVVVDLDGTERLQEETRAAGGGAMDDAGYRGSVFRADDQHVTSVAIGDDLLLEILRRVTPAQESVERRAQALRAAFAGVRGSRPAPDWRRRPPRRLSRSSV